MSENTLVQNDATDADNTTVENQAQATKTYSQEEVDNMMARMRGSLEKKLLKPYQDLGDPDELRNLKSEAERKAQEQQIKRGEFATPVAVLIQQNRARIDEIREKLDS